MKFTSITTPQIASDTHLHQSTLKGIGSKRVILIGADEKSRDFAYSMLDDKQFDVARVVVLADTQDSHAMSNGVMVVHDISRLAYHIAQERPDEIWVASFSASHKRLLEILALCRSTCLPVFVVNPLLSAMMGASLNPRIRSVRVPSLTPLQPQLTRKRISDISTALLFCALAFLPALLISLLIKLTSKGPILHKAKRVGKDGREFLMYKFRTMYINSEDAHRSIAKSRLQDGYHMGKIEGETYVTPVGRFLRRFSIDELPQLLNVLKGDMSMVGPRPCFAYEKEYFLDWHMRRFNVLPGMTGLWQVTGRQMENLSLDDAMIFDVYYSDNYSFALDVEILRRTISVVLSGKGA